MYTQFMVSYTFFKVIVYFSKIRVLVTGIHLNGSAIACSLICHNGFRVHLSHWGASELSAFRDFRNGPLSSSCLEEKHVGETEAFTEFPLGTRLRLHLLHSVKIPVNWCDVCNVFCFVLAWWKWRVTGWRLSLLKQHMRLNRDKDTPLWTESSVTWNNFSMSWASPPHLTLNTDGSSLLTFRKSSFTPTHPQPEHHIW